MPSEKDFVLDLRIDDLTVNAKVRASMKDKSYSVSMRIDGCGGIKQATCQCPRRKWICSHMAAASVYVNKKGFSKTDLPNSWIARPKKAANRRRKQYLTCFLTKGHTSKEFLETWRSQTKKFYLRSSVHQLPALCNGLLAQSPQVKSKVKIFVWASSNWWATWTIQGKSRQVFWELFSFKRSDCLAGWKQQWTVQVKIIGQTQISSPDRKQFWAGSCSIWPTCFKQ